MHAGRRDGRTHGLCAEARRPGEDLGGGQMLYQLRGEIDGVRFHGDAVGCADAIEPRVHAVVAHAVELVHETAEGGLSQPGVAVEVEDGGGLVDEIHFGGGHAGHEGLHVGGGGEVVQRAVEGGGGAGGRVAGERGGGIGGRRGVVWKRHRECVERWMRDARWLGGAFMAMHRTAHVWYAWKARELGVPAIPHACIVSAATRMHGGKMERRCINTPPRSIHLPRLHRISTTHTYISAMGFFKRKNEPLIPPVAPAAGQQQPKADPYAAPAAGGYGGGDPYTKSKPTPAATHEEKGGGDPYAATPAYAAGGDPYAKRNPGPRPNPNAANDAARAELFGGFSKAADVPAERKYGYEGREMEEDFDEDEEIEGIKQEMRGVKQDSLASTRCVLGVFFRRWWGIRLIRATGMRWRWRGRLKSRRGVRSPSSLTSLVSRRAAR